LVLTNDCLSDLMFDSMLDSQPAPSTLTLMFDYTLASLLPIQNTLG